MESLKIWNQTRLLEQTEFQLNFFWNDIKPFFLASINASHAKDLLSISQRREFLTFISKKDKSLCHTKNWRPISLLNCDYKIAAKSVANTENKRKPCLRWLIAIKQAFKKQVYWRKYIVVKKYLKLYRHLENSSSHFFPFHRV